MLERILQRIREKIRNREYVMTQHGRIEMIDDEFSIFDVERGILTGKILERQKNGVSSEWKYRIRGKTFKEESIEVVVKLSPTGKLVIITVYKIFDEEEF